MQSKKESLIETSTNTFFGLVVAWIITYFTMKYIVDIKIATTVSVFLCTVWSLFRGYMVRRYFATRRERKEKEARSKIKVTKVNFKVTGELIELFVDDKFVAGTETIGFTRFTDIVLYSHFKIKPSVYAEQHSFLSEALLHDHPVKELLIKVDDTLTLNTSLEFITNERK